MKKSLTFHQSINKSYRDLGLMASSQKTISLCLNHVPFEEINWLMTATSSCNYHLGWQQSMAGPHPVYYPKRQSSLWATYHLRRQTGQWLSCFPQQILETEPLRRWFGPLTLSHTRYRQHPPGSGQCQFRCSHSVSRPLTTFWPTDHCLKHSTYVCEENNKRLE